MKSVKIGHLEVPVRYEQLDAAMGIFHLYPNPAIAIDKKVQKTNMEFQVILHESIHAIDRLYKIGLKEKQVCVLKQTLTSLIRDNPKLIVALKK